MSIDLIREPFQPPPLAVGTHLLAHLHLQFLMKLLKTVQNVEGLNPPLNEGAYWPAPLALHAGVWIRSQSSPYSFYISLRLIEVYRIPSLRHFCATDRIKVTSFILAVSISRIASRFCDTPSSVDG